MNVPTSTLPPVPTTRAKSLFVSALFWLVLFAAGGLYSLVVLSPKLAERERLRQEYRGYRVELVSQESRLLRMQGISEALQSDTQFASELARTQLKTRSADEETIDVDESLSLQTPLHDHTDEDRVHLSPAPWYMPVVDVVAESNDARGVVLLAAVVLVLFAFGFLNDSLIEAPRAVDLKPGASAISNWITRYRQPQAAPAPVPRPRSPILDPSDDPHDDLA